MTTTPAPPPTLPARTPPNPNPADYFDLIGTEVAGLGYRAQPEALAALKPGDMLPLKREPTNQHDANAIMVGANTMRGPKHIGYLPRVQAPWLAAMMDHGHAMYARVESMSAPGVTPPTLRVTLRMQRGAIP